MLKNENLVSGLTHSWKMCIDRVIKFFKIFKNQDDDTARPKITQSNLHLGFSMLFFEKFKNECEEHMVSVPAAKQICNNRPWVCRCRCEH